MQKPPPVAIVGMSSLFAGSHDVLGFWRDIVSATDRLTDVPSHAWLIEDYYDPDPAVPDMTYAKRGGYLDPLPFNPMEFGLPPATIPATDSAQLIALVAAKRVLEDAGRFHDGDVDNSRTSVILGVASATELVVHAGARLQHPIWRKALRDAGLPESKVQDIIQRIKDHYQPWQESTFPGLLGNVIAGRIANRLDLGGSNFVTDAACASSISALQSGLSELYLGDSEMVIVGGVDALNDILMYMCFSKTPAFSPTGDCRPFSEDADGTLIGEGVGMLALRRLEDAEADGDPIYAVIRGLGASSDGKGSSVYAPRAEGQAQALLRAYKKAGYSPASVELVEAHGTATKAGDVAEVRGLTSVFSSADEDGRQWCALGSVKSQIGHTKAAAGSAGLIKVALALHHKILPPTLKVSKPNSKLEIADGPLYINTEARPWIRGNDHARRGSVSSFGFGGSNFHVALEEYTGPGKRHDRLRTWSEELLVLSAPTRADLSDALSVLQDRVDARHPLALIAYECAEVFDAKADTRVSIVAGDLEELSSKVARASKALGDGTSDELGDADIAFGFGEAEVGKIAFVFPGQGSQYVGMGAAAAMAFDSVRQVWDGAAGMEEFTNDRLDRAVFPPPAFTDEEHAAQTKSVTEVAIAQPAIAAVSLGYLSLLRQLGLAPDAAAGHSFGELSALAAAGRIPEASLLTIARRRGELMSEAAVGRAGAMIAVSTDAETVADLIGSDCGVVIANDNAPNEVVLAGAVADIETVAKKLRADGLTSIRLPVASAFHSPIVADSCEPFYDYLASVKWRSSSIAVYANASAEVYPNTARAARRLLADQVASPVRFRAMVEAMYRAGVTHFVEVGPGRVLTKLVGRCLGDRSHVAVALDDRGIAGLRAMWRGLGKLAAEGVELNLSALSTGYQVPDVPAERKPFEIMITGSNHDKPYPPKNGAAGRPEPNPEIVEPGARSHTATDIPTPSPMSLPGVLPAADAAMVPQNSAETARIQEATIAAHRRYQELMAESHRTFLDIASSALSQHVLPVAPSATVARISPPVPSLTPVPSTAPVPSAPPIVPPVSTLSVSETAGSPEVVPGTAEPEVTSAAPSMDVTALALEVVSGKTGYPVEMLDLELEMEAGLGIDSIKQVEILSELRERLPGMPEITPSELVNLRTLGDVADKLAANVPAVGTVAPSIDVTALALEIVSEKTGYPVEMLDLDMEMEAGLGIDSIKQVEILSELRERMPGMPEIAPSELASLRTLRDVADKLSEGMAEPISGCPVPVSAASTGEETAATGSSDVDVTALALEVVAEKTGYPVEMLDLDVEMEAGLGIDSIKQVEILSELQERLPGVTEFSPSELVSLRTLKDVANKLRSGGAKASPTGEVASVETGPVTTVRPSVVQASKPTTLAAFVPRIVPALRPGFGLSGLRPGVTVQVTNELPALATDLARGLIERGVAADIVERPSSAASAVISLAGLGYHTPGPQQAQAVHTSAIQAARIVAQHPEPAERLFVTIQSTGGGFGLDGDPGQGAWAGGLTGVVKTAAREWPGASLKAIDVADPKTAAGAILDELFLGGPAHEVGIAVDGSRSVVQIEPLPKVGTGSAVLEPGSVVVVSGGARGVTASAVTKLAEALHIRLALIGRSQVAEWPEGIPLSTDAVGLTGALAEASQRRGETVDLPGIQRLAQSLAANAEVRMSLAEFDARGIETLYLSADVTDVQQVTRALEQVREKWGPVAGIVHGAGVLRDKTLAEITPDHVADVFGPKVTGLSVLLEATKDDPIQLIALFSSIAARVGNAGQAAYSAANEVLNKVAAAEAYRRGSDCRVRSYNWGPWAGGMVDAGLAAHFDKQGIALLDVGTGAQFFVDELSLEGVGVERVVLAAPSFPAGTHRLTFTGGGSKVDSGSGVSTGRMAPALVADFALRLGQALKPVRTMRMYLEDFVTAMRGREGGVDTDGGHTVEIHPIVAAIPGYRLIFKDSSGHTHHHTMVRYSESGSPPPPSVPSGGLEPWPFAAETAYDTVLKAAASDRRSIVNLEGVSEEGGMALLRSTTSLGWPSRGFARGFDQAAFEGLLQLGELWTHHKAGAMQELARMGTMVVHHLETIPERLRSGFRARKTETGTLFDFILATEEGDLVAELLEVQFDAHGA